MWILPTAAAGMICLMLYVSLPKLNNNLEENTFGEVNFNEVANIIKYRCGVCHSSNPTYEGFEEPPMGIIFDTTQDIIKNIKGIKDQVIDSDIMPPGNITGITENERNILRAWIEKGANINN